MARVGAAIDRGRATVKQPTDREVDHGEEGEEDEIESKDGKASEKSRAGA
jgi:hypothetical protein